MVLPTLGVPAMLRSLARSVALSRCRSARSLLTTAAPAVVDARYCAPHATTLTAAETWFDDFPVKDARDGETVMRVKEALFSFTRRHLLLDVSAASSRPVLTVERSPTFFEVRRRWKVYDGDSTNGSDLLFDAVEPPLFGRGGDVHVHLAGRGERDPDYIIESRGFFSSEYTVYRGSGGAIARIEHRATLVDLLCDMLAYKIDINPGVDRAFVVALTVVLAEISHDDAERRHRQRTLSSR